MRPEREVWVSPADVTVFALRPGLEDDECTSYILGETSEGFPRARRLSDTAYPKQMYEVQQAWVRLGLTDQGPFYCLPQIGGWRSVPNGF